MNGFSAIPESFGPGAAQIRQAADALTAQWSQVAGETQAVRFGPGYDAVSPLIKVSIESALGLLEECMTSSADALRGFADGLEIMGEIYATSEQEVGELMAGVD